MDNNEDGTSDLIMDQNINSDGTPAGITGVTQATNGTQYNLVAWINASDYGTAGGTTWQYLVDENTYGPVTAMKFLYNATKDWTNVEPITYTYKDKETQAGVSGYTSIESTNGIAVITPTTGNTTTIGTSDEPLRARMPIYASDTSITEVTSKTNASYLYDNLDPSGSPAPYGYWTLSSSDSSYSEGHLAWHVFYYQGKVTSTNVANDDDIGVRPVITVKL